MSYKLEKPYTEAQRINFIVEYNHNKGLQIEETMEAMYALESNEIMQQNRPIINPNYETEQVQKKQEELNMFSLTAAVVGRPFSKVKGFDFDDILEVVKDNPNIDSKALKIELKANNFYRGNPYVSAIGNLLGFTEEQLDKFFETGNYEELM